MSDLDLHIDSDLEPYRLVRTWPGGTITVLRSYKQNPEGEWKALRDQLDAVLDDPSLCHYVVVNQSAFPSSLVKAARYRLHDKQEKGPKR